MLAPDARVLQLVNPSLVTPASDVIKYLVREYVDDTSADFAVLSTADDLKDYVKSYFAGTVASALAYLAMIGDGYVWSDHFENIGGGNKATKRTPDFVFARPGATDVALMESKGTRSATAAAFDKTVADGYTGQVEPHLGYTFGTATATHGYSIGSLLTSTTKAELNAHHTDTVAVTPGGGPTGGSISSVQRHNYATAFRLAHSEDLSWSVRTGNLSNEIPFFQFEWLGRQWLTSDFVHSYSHDAPERYYEMLRSIVQWEYPRWSRGQGHFAVERNCAEAVLRGLSESRAESASFDLTPMPRGLIQEARSGEGQSAVFPDGLAVSYEGFLHAEGSRIVVWRREKQGFEVYK